MEMSLGAVTGCGTLLAGVASSRSVMNDGAKSASLNTAGLNGHSPQLENPDTALSIVLGLACCMLLQRGPQSHRK